ncbi:hypothetical protein [Streptomyces sp. YKOK-I1]
MTTPDDDEADDWEAARTERLLRIPADQIVHYGYGTILDWLDARREQHTARLRAACQTLRELNSLREHAHARLVAAQRPNTA